jgi:all-trans-8'-apo-beta-carotenal 15,15'-oxygenase
MAGPAITRTGTDDVGNMCGADMTLHAVRRYDARMTTTQTAPRGRADMKTIARELDFTDLRVEGKLPDALRGTLVRTGPGLYELFGKKVGHSFEADGVLSALRFRGDGLAEGALKLIESEGLKAERRAGKPLFGTRTAYPRRLWNSLRRVRKNTGNTALMTHGQKLFAMVESAMPTEIDPQTLRTIGATNLGVIEQSFSAHPHRVHARNATIGFGLEYGKDTFVHLYSFEDAGSVRRLGKVALTRPVMLHDFICTATHALFLISPVRLHIFKSLFGLANFQSLFTWEPGDGTEVLVIPLDDTANFTRFTVDPFLQWHFAHAKNEGDDLIVHFVKHEDFSSYDGLRASGDARGGRLVRGRVETQTKRLTMDEVWDVPSEFPRIDPRLEGIVSGDFSTVFLMQDNPGARSVSMVNVKTGKARTHALESHEAGSEVVFVPRSKQAAEGDGWALVLVYDRQTDQSHLRIIDTARFEESVARCYFPEWVPMTFHGLWMPDA